MVQRILNLTIAKAGLATVILTAALIGAYCLIEPDGLSDTEAVTQTARTYVQEAYQGDFGKAYSLIDSSSRRECSREDFEEIYMILRGLGTVTGRTNRISDVLIREIDDKEAQVEVWFEDAINPHKLRIVKERGRWLLHLGACGERLLEGTFYSLTSSLMWTLPDLPDGRR